MSEARGGFGTLTDAAYQAGYFDQSHFIKDFRLFTGRTPKDFFSDFQYW
jgi:AraC-like DNA-binding protein